MSFVAKNQDRLETLACFLAPLALVGIIAVAGAPPAPEVRPPRALETSEGDAEPIQTLDRATLEGDALEAFDAETARLLSAGTIASVFPARDPAPVDAHERSAPEEPERPEFSLTSVMSGANGAICVINQSVRRVGAEVAPGWRVAAIDAETRSVTLEGPAGESVTLRQGL